MVLGQSAARLIAAASLCLFACAAEAAHASEAFMPLGGRVAPPRGYLEFCAREPAECPEFPRPGDLALQSAPSAAGSQAEYWRLLFASVKPAAFSRPSQLDPIMPTEAPEAPPFEQTNGASRELVAVSGDVWRQLNEVNRYVNAAVRPRSDRATYGRDDYWALPLKSGRSAGDCEDYVLEKRRLLREHGYPAAALSVAVVRTAWGQDHSVLLVDTDRGEVVLDSLSPWVVSWRAVSYRWVSRQSPTDPAVWIGGPAAPK